MTPKQIKSKVRQLGKHLGHVNRLSAELSNLEAIEIESIVRDANALNLLCSHAQQHLHGLQGHVNHLEEAGRIVNKRSR